MLLAIESSCDESALALFDPARGLAGEWVHSQIALHREYGGVVPDLASREHLERFPALLALAAQTPAYAAVTQIAVTCGPGLAGCLAQGLALAAALALKKNVPLLGVNHLRGHVWSPFVGLHAHAPLQFAKNLRALLPHLGLIVSGGNTILFVLEEGGKLRILNRTVDDAAGEALDKGAKLLGLPYPGGPLVEQWAAKGNPQAYEFPRALGEGAARATTPFSFSGLKTSLRYRLEKMTPENIETAKADLCASYQAAVVGQLVAKTAALLQSNVGIAANVRSIGLSGGVANNQSLRKEFARVAAENNLPFLVAEPRHTGDNAAMIAFTAWVDAVHTKTFDSSHPAIFEPSLTLA
ncbi:MAG TPA: tRNA (adenosine(37)-N6)-threonylcarbamoyltransferase complex transferase subunit TsaD [Opitutales bacterium]|jgi:N6-L-threonylcarbamoyladenine synthase|nr:tRNA (adenosine(37)-N6)-threonylcarbamoyltransferase complex transferase subunit TsaD [Opitutales bacterium]